MFPPSLLLDQGPLATRQRYHLDSGHRRSQARPSSWAQARRKRQEAGAGRGCPGSATPRRHSARGRRTALDRQRREVGGLPGPLDSKVLAVVDDPERPALLLQSPIASGFDVAVGEHDRAVADIASANNAVP